MDRKDLNKSGTYGINSHRKRAVRVFYEKIKTAEGIIVELKIWRVPKSEDYPEGFKYSFFAVCGGKVLVGYDNHRPKGHHRHFLGQEEKVSFRGLGELKRGFLRDLDVAKKLMR